MLDTIERDSNNSFRSLTLILCVSAVLILAGVCAQSAAGQIGNSMADQSYLDEARRTTIAIKNREAEIRSLPDESFAASAHLAISCTTLEYSELSCQVVDKAKDYRLSWISVDKNNKSPRLIVKKPGKSYDLHLGYFLTRSRNKLYTVRCSIPKNTPQFVIAVHNVFQSEYRCYTR